MTTGVLTSVLVCCGAVPEGERAVRYANEAYHLGGLLALAGFRVVTNGKMGLAHEVCRGAKAASGSVHTVTLRAAESPTTPYMDTTEDHNDSLVQLRVMLAEAHACVMFGPGMYAAYVLYAIMEHMDAGLVPPETPVLLCKAFPDDFAEPTFAPVHAAPARIANTPLDAVDALLVHFAPPAPR